MNLSKEKLMSLYDFRAETPWGISCFRTIEELANFTSKWSRERFDWVNVWVGDNTYHWSKDTEFRDQIENLEIALDRGCYNTEGHRDALIQELQQLRRLQGEED